MNFHLSNLRAWILLALIAGVTVSLWYGIRFEQQVERRFQASRSSFPSRIYARAAVLYPGMDVEKADLARYLARVGYKMATHRPVHMGEYMPGSDEWIIGVRPFTDERR